MTITQPLRKPIGGRTRVGALAAVLLVCGLVAGGCITVESSHGGFRMANRVHIEEGEVARDEIVVMGGSVRVDGTAREQVVVIGGSVTINGRAESDVVCIFGSMRLGPDAHIRGDVVNVGGSLNRSPGAQIDGEVVDIGISGFDGIPGFGGLDMSFGRWWGFSPFHAMFRTMQFVYWLLLALLTVALVGDRVSSAAHSIQREPFRLGAIGIVGFVALFFLTLLFCILSILLIGIPFLIALMLGWSLAYIFGIVSLFHVIGQKVTVVLGKADASQLGLVMTGAAVLGFLHFFPWIGALLWTVGAFVGLGAAFATRFGTNQPWMGSQAPPLVTGPTAPE